MKAIVKKALCACLALCAVAVLCGCTPHGAAPLTVSMENYLRYNENYYERLREEYSLDTLIEGCETSFDKAAALTAWVTNLWLHDGANTPEQSGPLYILEQVTQNGARYRCVEYDIVLRECLLAVGVPARTIGLKTQDVETRQYGAGHVVTEFYSAEQEKWVFVDGQNGIMAHHNGALLSAAQLLPSLQGGQAEWLVYKDFTLWQADLSEDGYIDMYVGFIAEYLYFIDTAYKTSYGKWESLMLVPEGATPPKKFQIEYRLKMDRYTSNEEEFYPRFEEG